MSIIVRDKAGNRQKIAGVGMPGPAGKSAYQYAADGGFAGTEAEFSALLGQQSNPNLLDNWYFLDPINQRGQTEYEDKSGQYVYTIDRFQMYNGAMSITAGGLQLTGASPTSYTIIRQLVPVKNNPNLLFSAIINAQIYSCSMGNRVAVSNVGTLACEYAGTNVIVSFTCTGDAVVSAAKLELGSVQTLAHQDASGNWVLNDAPPNRALELAKCQKYQIFGELAGSKLWNFTDYAGSFFIPTHVSMRAEPNIIGSIKYFEPGNSAGYNEFPTVPVILPRLYKNGIYLYISIEDNSLLLKDIYGIYIDAQSGFDANL